MSQFLTMFQQLGPEKFSLGIATVAPYFASIDPEVVALRPGHAEVLVRNQRKVHNHIGTVHAIALCNGAELAAGMCTDVSIPTGALWLPVGMNVKYLAKAKTDIRVLVEGEQIDWTQPGNIDVPLAGYDTEGVKVFSATITMNVKHAG